MNKTVCLGDLSVGDYFCFSFSSSEHRYQVKAIYPDRVLCLECWGFMYRDFCPDCVVRIVKSSHPELD